MASDWYARHDHELEGWDEVERGGGRRPAPGKVPRTLRLGRAGRAPGAGEAAERGASVAGAVAGPAAERAAPGAGGAGVLQARAPGALRDPGDPFALHAVAQGGVTGGGGPLPHLAAIQASFGHHDVSGVRAHVGGGAAEAADAIGASAYATGDDVAFAGAPDLHLAAHEAAHVVQQRGGVRLAGRVGEAGDLYEQHADAVADAVVRGDSAEALLDRHAHRDAAGGPAVQRDGEIYGDDTALSLPEGVTEAQVDAAIAYNDGRQFRIDWVRRMQSHVRADGAMTSLDGHFDRDTIAGILRIQAAAGLTADGRITAEIRRLLERLYPDLHGGLLGPHLDAGRVLVPAGASTAERYTAYRNIITRAGGVFLDQPREINLLAIRGVVITGTAPSLEITQSGSAAELATARAEDDAALAEGSTEGSTDGSTGGSAGGGPLHADAEHPPEHFSGRAGYDDVIISIWFELDGTTPVHHVTEHRGSVDPASAWSQSDANPHQDTEGSAHLRDGQYLYRLGTHTAGSPAHAHAVWDRYHGAAHSPVHVAGTRDDAEYSALVPSRDLEIWRDRPGTAGDDHYPTAEEETESETHVAEHDEHDDRYTTRRIAIDVHSSPAAGPSSVGCQTVPVDADYDDLIGEIRGSANPRSVYYTLIDASRVDAGLVTVRSGPESPGPSSDAPAGPAAPAAAPAPAP
jgi:hypothetical protein